ncbi:NAD-dependent succinate-semialdehyde dehydrogenase [Enterovirga rhinocerotis]|uniref:Succinate-semialdehyde dehydrogenase/glutarate-semialdehyde dehydrogenase n=1 Tax=Enterovirga rhinocerotis TaxID=1339210 RepID=A0A4R7C453_9HYPH|nr:NAD-dependent succinate-semialdehyde dehydrogenase [Enterovirga rhinocerotis]TDR92921.1 succinate-semialdehyde dehydrogenase/glutarate-semialdehyde dehydrogenase [Enterovirga rhinocerotis]
MNADYANPEMYVAGRWLGPVGGSADILNPATEAVIGEVPHADVATLDEALAAAEKGFGIWRDTPLDRRVAILLEAARLMRERADVIARLMTLEQGKPVGEARLEVVRASALVEWDAHESKRLYGRIIPGPAGQRQMVLRLPLGPVAAFTPWNFPASVLARKLGGALAAGCSLVVKAAEETPATATALVRCFVDAGLPAGVLNLVFGVPAEVSDHLIGSPVIRAITFTGSVPVGKLLAAKAGSLMKPAVMELGGHSPVIVCRDTDVARAAALSAAGKFRNAGQICTAPTRFIVEESIHDAFVEHLVAAARAIKVGDGLDPDTKMGPLANDRRRDAIEALVSDAEAKGASVPTGGKRIGNRGFFFEPTVLTDVPFTSDVMTTEPFGPVAPVVRFSELDEAIGIANALPYGLASYAFTESAAAAAALSDRVETGIMSINHVGGSMPEAPFGGVKESGLGREGGMEGMDAYINVKFVSHRATIR